MSESFLHTHPQSFVHLHLHTQYSLLDGAIRVKDLMVKAKELGMPAIAQTDHGNMFGAIDFYLQAKAAGIRPILGSEVYFSSTSRFDRRPPVRNKVLNSQDAEESRHHIHHLVLLCKNLTGYKNLCQLISKAYLEGFYYKPRIDYELLQMHHEGLVATTACLKGEVGYNFYTGQDEKAISAILKLHGIFQDDLYLEIQENGIEEQKIVNEKIIHYARQHQLQLVATNDCHYLSREDATAQEVLLCIQTGKIFADENRMKLTTNEFFLKSAEQMRAAFAHVPDACDNTLKIADKCHLDFHWRDEKGQQIYHLPDFATPNGEKIEEYFAQLSRMGLQERFQGPHFTELIQQPRWQESLVNDYQLRLENEISMIIKMGFAGYFLIVSDFIQWAKERDIPVGPGRGSGAGSLVAYALKITNIDPIPYHLLFERFINPERVSLPDFDVDFCQDRRQEVIDYVTEKYGEDRVGQIITFGQLKAKAVIRDVGRVYGLPYSEVDMLAKLVPDELGISLEKAIELEPKIREMMEIDPKVRQIINISKKLEGLLRHASIHAAGVIITNQPLVNYCPLFRGREGERVVQFDKNFAETIGLVKFDFLGLKTLSVIKTAEKHIRQKHVPSFDIEAISLEDDQVYNFISQGHTVGIFQLESPGMIDLCKRIMPGNLDDITAINALYRPGPLESGMVDDFIEIKHGRKQLHFPFPELETVLKDTYGVIVYQEQVMNIARIVAGYSLGQADMLRRAMGKKKVEEMNRHREIFVTGAKKNGFDEEKAANLFDLMSNFAAYGFNKSHAVAYALIAYQTAFLKYYYPAEFFASILSYEMDNIDKITLFINDAKSFGVNIYPPDVNQSLWHFNVVEKNIRFGMGAVKNVGEGAAVEIIREREENGPYQGINDFCERINHRQINRRVVEALIKVGAFDQCEQKLNRPTMLDNLELIIGHGQKLQQEKANGQMGLFDFGVETLVYDGPTINILPDFDHREKLLYEKELIGIYVSGHPLDKYAGVMSQLTSMNIAQVQEVLGEDKRTMLLSGLIIGRKQLVTKKGDKMCFATLEDLSGKIECIVFPKTFAEYEDLLTSVDPLIIEGEVRLAEHPRKLFPTKIQKLKEQAEERVTGVRISVDLNNASEIRLNRLRELCLSYRGAVPVHIVFSRAQVKARMPLGSNYLVLPSPQLAAKINEIFMENSVQFIVDGKLEAVN